MCMIMCSMEKTFQEHGHTWQAQNKWHEAKQLSDSKHHFSLCLHSSFLSSPLLGSANCTFDNDTQKWMRSPSLSRACMRIVLQRVGICFAHVILKSMMSGWLWERWECFLRRKRGLESILQHLECFCNGCGGWESFLQLWFPTHKSKIFASPPWESLCKTLESISGTTVAKTEKN